MLPRIRPMRLRRIPTAFDDPEYLFELKHDGFRAIVYLESGECRLVSRNLKNLKFDALWNALAKLPVEDAVLDGEIICLDSNGVSRFNSLLDRKGEPILCAFDLLWLDGEDLRKFPLIVRKGRLQALVQASGSGRLLYAQHVEHRGKEFFTEVCKLDLEGIVAKRKNSVYRDDGTGWLKIKNPSYSQAEGRHELLTRKRSGLVLHPRLSLIAIVVAFALFAGVRGTFAYRKLPPKTENLPNIADSFKAVKGPSEAPAQTPPE